MVGTVADPTRIDKRNVVDFIFLTTPVKQASHLTGQADISQSYTEHFDEWILFFKGNVGHG